MMLYVVTDGEYSSYCIRAIFDEPAKAEAFIAILGAGRIEPWELNAVPSWAERDRACFAITFYERTGRTSVRNLSDVDREQSEHDTCKVTKGESYIIVTPIWARTAEEATKIASEKRAQFLAQQPH